MWQTEEECETRQQTGARPLPGLVLVWSGAAPLLRAFEIAGDGLVLGRELLGRELVDAAGPLADDRISRQHAQVRVADGGFVVRDLGSRNGTYVGSKRIDGEAWVHAPAVIRTGRTIGLLVEDIRRFLGARIELAGAAVVGPTLADPWQRVERAGRTGDNLLLTGESGTGKELAARAFHAATGAPGDLVSVNCAAIPAGVAERLLFGARRGAYSGADRDADGYLVSADRGTIFLDEIGELELSVQAKLLRVLETREVLPLGAARPKQLELRIVAATLRDLRDEVAERRFREDLYHRVGRPEVHLPPLRERLEDIPHLIARTAAAAVPGLALQPTLVESCLLRRWPGNARELIGEIRRAALAARDAGAAELGLEDIDPMAGLIIERKLRIPASLLPPGMPSGPASCAPPSASSGAPPSAQTSPSGPRAEPAPLPDRDTIVRSLLAEGGNVARAARQLGLHRNQLRRFLARHPELALDGDTPH